MCLTRVKRHPRAADFAEAILVAARRLSGGKLRAADVQSDRVG